jgi:hypothetical protein
MARVLTPSTQDQIWCIIRLAYGRCAVGCVVELASMLHGGRDPYSVRSFR